MIAAKKTKAKAKPDLPDTMLTGASGVDMNSLEVAKPTLLGG